MRAFDLVFLDCDSTLSAIEGIDELATRRGIDVSQLTARAMAGELTLDEVYGERLRRIRPTAADLEWVAGRYREAEVPGVRAAIRALQAAEVEVHVLSGGLLRPVRDFAMGLGIPAKQVHAVPFTPPEPGAAGTATAGPAAAGDAAWNAAVEAACAHPLARNGGKPEFIEAVATSLGVPRARRLLVGDGAADLEAGETVGLFVGFGGVAERPAVRAGAGAWLPGPSLEPLVALVLGPQG